MFLMKQSLLMLISCNLPDIHNLEPYFYDEWEVTFVPERF